MKSMKKIVLVLLVAILVIPSFFVTASTSDNEQNSETSPGEASSKDEVVYATLSATGDSQELYVVNALDVTKPGRIIDYGTYSNLKNLTNVSQIEQENDKVQFSAPEGKFYYQGNMEETSLPWDFSITYLLDGKVISPEDLVGKDGQLQFKIDVAENKEMDHSLFFENYLLQISINFNSEKARNIEADNGMIANAGKNQQVTFTVMPDQKEELIVHAEVENFEFDGIDIAGVPSTMPIEEPDFDDMKDDMGSLSDAIRKINDGVDELYEGVAALHDGTAALRDGSSQYHNGIASLASASSELINGSTEINQALETISSSVSNTDEIGIGDLAQLPEGLTELANGLKETATGLSTLKSNYKHAYDALDKAMSAIPTPSIIQTEIQALYESGANPKVVEKLVETYTTSQIAKGTYTEVKQAFAAVDDTLGTVSSSLNTMANEVDGIVNGLASLDGLDGLVQLQEGLDLLATNYKKFHTGLVGYTDGVSQLAQSYGELHAGISDLSTGTGELASGVSELHDGTTELHKATSTLPEEMTAEIDEMIAAFDKSDFEAVSFVSDKNDNVQSVQFVLKTEGIKKEEIDSNEEPVEEKKGFWARLKDLFL